MARNSLIGMMGKSTSRQVLGRFGSEKSTVSTATSRPAPTAAAICSVSNSFLVLPDFLTAIAQAVSRSKYGIAFCLNSSSEVNCLSQALVRRLRSLRVSLSTSS